ncbi:hypothetical protein FRC08_005276 [Ceratobasidium sp. 394]|nr:hypothetical protein FRC08_005276 [Ceratobasidium sp. 394]
MVSNVRGDSVTYTHLLIKYAYDVTPKSKARLDTLLEDKNFNFLYEKETKVSSKQAGFCCHEAVSRVICALLFNTPSKIGLLYMDQLCLVDKAEDWHEKLKDHSPDAKRGVPIGLIAFAGVLIMHVLECVRDENPSTSRKAHKFEGTRYRKQWTRIRDRLIKDKFLGKLRVRLLQAVKARYNEMNDGSGDGSSSSDSSSSSKSKSDIENSAGINTLGEDTHVGTSNAGPKED